MKKAVFLSFAIFAAFYAGQTTASACDKTQNALHAAPGNPKDYVRKICKLDKPYVIKGQTKKTQVK